MNLFEIKRLRLKGEELEQALFFHWVDGHLDLHPVMRWIYAIPNGGQRNKLTAVKLKATGLRSGVWDVLVPYPTSSDSGAFIHGLWIEFKYGKNGLTDNQKEFRRDLEPFGWGFEVVYSSDEAIEIVKKYLDLS